MPIKETQNRAKKPAILVAVLKRTSRLPYTLLTRLYKKKKSTLFGRGTRFMISGFLPARHGASAGCEWRNGLQYGGYLRIYWI